MTKRVLWYALLVLLCCSLSVILVHAAKTTSAQKAAVSAQHATAVKPKVVHGKDAATLKALKEAAMSEQHKAVPGTPVAAKTTVEPAPTAADIAGWKQRAENAREEAMRSADLEQMKAKTPETVTDVKAETEKIMEAKKAALIMQTSPVPLNANPEPTTNAMASPWKAQKDEMYGLMSRPNLTPIEKDRLLQLQNQLNPTEPLSPPNSGGRRGLDATGGPDAFGYRFVDSQSPDAEPYSWVELNNEPGATRITTWNGSADDGYSNLLPVGFTFPFYTGNYTQLRVCTNGNIQFTTTSTSYNAALPSTNVSGPGIFLYWRDLNTSTTGRRGVWYKAYTNYFIVEFDSVTHYSSSSPFAAQAILYLDGTIKMMYRFVTVGNNCTVGIQASGTGPALQYSYNGSPQTLGNTRAVKFYVPAALSNDFGTVSVSSPTATTYAPGAAVPVTALFKNFGTTQQSAPVAYQFGTDPAVTGENTPILAQNGTDPHTFGTSVTMPLTNGRYLLKVYTDLGTDQDRTNDTAYVNVKVGCPDYTVTLPAQAPYTYNSTLVGAGDDVAVYGTGDGPDEVYQINVTQAGTYTFSTCNTSPSFDTYIGLSATCFGTEIAYNDDYCAPLSKILCQYLAVGTYYFAVNTYSSSTTPGPYRLDITLESTSPNDLCANAQSVTVAPSGSNSVTGTLVTCNTSEVFSTCNGVSAGYYGVWYTVTGNGNNMTASTCNAGTAFDTRLFVFSGTCTGLVCVTANDNASPACATLNTLSKVSWCANSGVTYYVCLSSGVSGTAGAYQLDFTDTGVDCSLGRCCYGYDADPQNPSCTDNVTVGNCNSLSGIWTSQVTCTATPPYGCPTYVRGTVCAAPFVITSLAYNDTGSTANMGNEYDFNGTYCIGSSYDNGPDVVYKYVPTANISIDVNLFCAAAPSGTYPYGSVSIWEGCPNGTNCISGAYDYALTHLVLSCVALSANHTYFIMVDNYAPGPDSIRYGLHVTECVPCPTVSCSYNMTETETNGGCLATPYDLFNPVSSGSIVAATAASITDYDAYELVITNAPQTITVVVNPEFDAAVRLNMATMEDVCPDSLTLVTVNAAPRCGTETLTYIARANGIYHIYVYPTATPTQTNYCMTVTTATFTPPEGDNCANPYVIPSLPYSHPTDSTCGSFYNDYFWPSTTTFCMYYYYANQNDVVYQYSPMSDIAVNITLTPTSSSYYSSVSVWDDCPNTGATNCVYGTAAFSGVLSISCLPLTGGHTYYIMVDDESYCTRYALDVTECTPCPTVSCEGATAEDEPNDGCMAPAPTYAPFKTVTNGSLIAGTVTSDGSVRDFDGYELVVNDAPVSLTVTVNPEFDATIQLAMANSADACPDSVSNLLTVNSAPRCGTETMSYDISVNGTYHIYVYPASAWPPLNPAKPYCMTVTTATGSAPGNDLCAGAFSLSVPSSVSGTTHFATADYPAPGEAVYCGSYAYGPGVWYTVEGTGDTLVVSLCSSVDVWNSKLAVYTGACGSLVCYSSNDDACATSGHAKVSFCSVLGQTYYVLVYSSTAGLAGNFTLDVTAGGPCRPCGTCTPANVDLGVVGTTVYGYTVTDSCWFSGKWVGSFTAEVGDKFHFDLCPATPGTGSVGFFAPSTGFDPDIKITDASCTILTGEDGSCTGGINTYQPNDFQWTATTSGTYYVIIAPYSSYSSHNCAGAASQYFTMNYYREECRPLPTNDNCDQVSPVSLPLDGSELTFSGDNTCATPDCDLFSAYGDGNVWHAFDLADVADVVLDYCGTAGPFGNAWLNLAIGCPCTGNTAAATWEVTTCPDGNITMTWRHLAAGTYYYPVMRDGTNNARGAYTIHVKVIPCDGPVADLTVYQAEAPNADKVWLRWTANTYGGYDIYKTLSYPPVVDPANLVATVGAATNGPMTWVDPDNSAYLAYYAVVHNCNATLGRCCYGEDPQNPGCLVTTQTSCVALGGSWVAGLTCETTCPIAGTGDECTTAFIITNGVPSYNDYTVATPPWNTTTPDAIDFYEVNSTLWFAYTTASTNDVTVTVCFPQGTGVGSTNFDTVIGVEDACGGTWVASNDDNCTYAMPDNYYPSALTFTPSGLGVTYYICVGAFYFGGTTDDNPATTATLLVTQ